MQNFIRPLALVVILMMAASLLPLQHVRADAPPCFAWLKRSGATASELWYYSDGLELNRNPSRVFVVQTLSGGHRRSFNRWVEDAQPISGSKPLRWPVKYSSLTYSEMLPSFPYAGVNEHGLMIALVPLSRDLFGRQPSFEDDEVTPETDSFLEQRKFAWLSPFELMQVILDTARNVGQAKNRLLRLNHLPQPFGMPFQIVFCDRRKCRVAVPNDSGLPLERWIFHRIPKTVLPLVTRLPISNVFDFYKNRTSTAILSGRPILHDYALHNWLELSKSLSQQESIKVPDVQIPVLRISKGIDFSWHGRSHEFLIPNRESALMIVTPEGIRTFSSSSPTLIHEPRTVFSLSPEDANVLSHSELLFQSRFMRTSE